MSWQGAKFNPGPDCGYWCTENSCVHGECRFPPPPARRLDVIETVGYVLMFALAMALVGTVL